VQGSWKGLGSYGTLGLEMVLGVLLPCYVGSLADKRWQTGDLFLIIGFFLGLAHAVRAVWRALERTKQEAQAAEEQRKRDRQKYYDDRDQG
jgi:F0F1-type ATP synthase assembly protein I